ncbi:interferon alpha/beta receptor 1b-like isoform X2 [Myripristis murdjan]|uniref:Interferon alpha/beta receptor 1b-like n=1 Tax=Myripristis murdjan TaxID=586833 RepID=A0A667YHA2_9TELE|nr:interferon alpha/beta receptor 1b-like isoform X2 [Myripristis murdjan]
MFAVFYVSVLMWCFTTSAVEAELAAPQDLDMITMNTQYILSWNWDQSTAGGHPVTFTAQYLAKFKLKWKKKSWTTVCDRTSQTCCDMTALNLHYHGIFMFRVQASSGRNHSEWAIKEFCPDKEAALGPPSKVVLAPAGNHLDVTISDPLTSANTSMRENIHQMYYRIVYWEHSTDTQALRKQTVNTSANLVTLSDLKAWTFYCVTVQSRYDYYNKSSTFTHPDCIQTEGPIPWWQILLYFLVSLMICFLVVLLSLYGFYRCYTTLKATFFPSIQLPPHIQEYLCSSPGSDVPRLLTPDSEAEVMCDKLSICPEVVHPEIHGPPPSEDFPVLLEPDTSGRHSRQDSGGSGDSGVYSNEGGSGLRQPPSTQCSVGMEDSWQSPSDLMQVKMKDMGSEVRGHHLITDEGIMDMCV